MRRKVIIQEEELYLTNKIKPIISEEKKSIDEIDRSKLSEELWKYKGIYNHFIFSYEAN